MASRGKRYTEEQIIAILKEAAASGATVGEVLRRHGVSPKTYYGWKAKYGGLEVSEARRLKQLGSLSVEPLPLLRERLDVSPTSRPVV